MNKWFLLVAITSIVLLSGCASQQQPVPVINESESQSSSGTNVSAVTVTIQNFAFMPTEITVKKGTKVTWVNSDKVAHTVTGSNNEFDSGEITPGNTFSYVFADVGTVEYSCKIHPNMKGKVTVT